MSKERHGQGIRCFLAVDISPQIKELVLQVRHKCKGHDLPLRWVNPDGIHLTLKFLGEIDPGLVDRIADTLDRAAPLSSDFTVSFKEVGAFPHARKARVLWLGVDRGREELVALQRKIDHELDLRLKVDREKRPFTPHLTLARMKVPGPMDQLLAAISVETELIRQEMQVHDLRFYKSTLRPAGAEYSVIRTFQFQKSP